ncbi:MAG: hypothetical protein ABS68_01765 [Niastella sp. SCN 39-18]|nr:hypothetical protein [Sphingobacteriales bacterium]ODT54520.1 MAG: hypothetical protein ABS68_01765 [Niastella sp. SCN 39-18]
MISKSILFLLLVLILVSCSPSFNRDKALFDRSAVKAKFKAIDDLNDCYFEIKENGFTDFYCQLYDSLKNTHYPGRYTQQEDTLLLKFYNKEAYKMLGKKALISHTKKEIVFFDVYPGIRNRLLFN